MALQPTRPIGSTQVLTFSGSITTGVAFLNFPKPNATIATDATLAPGFTGIRFLLGDVSVPATPTQTLPGFVFDDSQLAGVSPHDPVATAAVGTITLANEEDITARTWCENTYITIEPNDAASALILTGVDLNGAQFVIDTLTSGLGTNTGLPVLILPCELSALPTIQAPLNVTVIVEVRHTASR